MIKLSISSREFLRSFSRTEMSEMGVIQINGKLEESSLKAKGAHARVRVRKGEVLVLSMADRGVLEDGAIRRCTENERYKPLTPDSVVRVDIDDGSEGGKTVVAWAPK